jgi:hypothetical protein
MEQKYVIINGVVFLHGEKVRFQPITNTHDEKGEEYDLDEEVIGKISILDADDKNPVKEFYVCQDDYDGALLLGVDRFEYKYSWHVIVNDNGNIISGDTKYIKKLEVEEETLCRPCKDVDNFFIFEDNIIDDDIMPDDWFCEEDLKNI